MGSLEDAVPEYDGTKDAALTVGSALVGMVPIVGGPIAQVAGGLIASQQAKRQDEFNQIVATTIERLVAEKHGLTPEEIVESPEFMAAYSKASRVAAETTSETKRQRLARALRHAGPWSFVAEDRRIKFLSLVADLEDYDVAILGYFKDPGTWLRENSEWVPGLPIRTSPMALLFKYFIPFRRTWAPFVELSVQKLKREGLLSSENLDTAMTDDGLSASRTTRVGNEFINFLES